ncbi:MAG: hypothetical protein HON76_10680 [Candidatus Scalindua sp.]|jgi:hypothetical protein|nr:hypothetical protein [Candidatus Scalindua sp.]MBT6230560.1 hypothetical protein [Candidatus Scalindua sp.]MBT6562977.1 hypothetical protein [Candidatus Scalindua sp.]
MTDEFTERQQKAFSFAESSIKHMTGLCTVIFASSVLLSKFYIPEKEGVRTLVAGLLLIPWLSLMASVLFGVIAMVRLTGVYSKKGAPKPPSINDDRISQPVKRQIVAFFIGLISLMIVTVFANVISNT